MESICRTLSGRTYTAEFANSGSSGFEHASARTAIGGVKTGSRPARQRAVSGPEKDSQGISIVDTCNALLEQALTVFTGPGGINDQLAAMSLNPPLPPVGSILKLSAPLDAY